MYYDTRNFNEIILRWLFYSLGFTKQRSKVPALMIMNW